MIEMEGLYLYCIREKTKEHQSFSIKGIDGKGEVLLSLSGIRGSGK